MKRFLLVAFLATGFVAHKAMASGNCAAKPGVPALEEQHRTAAPAATYSKSSTCPDKKEVKKKTGKEVLPKKTVAKEEEDTSEFRIHPFSRMERS